MREYRKTRPEHYLSLQRASHQREREKHPDRVRERARKAAGKYRARHTERLRAARPAQDAASYRRYRAKKIQQARAYRQANTDRVRKTKRRYLETNRTAVYAAHHDRRVKQRAGERYTPEQWERLKAKYDHRCVACRKQEPVIALTVDHVIPLHHGGSNAIGNIQPLCKSCNSRKGIQHTDYRPDWE